MPVKNFSVEQNKLRLDRFLSEQFSDVSRSRIQKDIKAGKVSVNGSQIFEGKYVVRAGDSVEYDFKPEEKPAAQNVELNVVYEDANLLVIDKPAGLVVHPAPGYRGPTVVGGLLHKYKDIKIVGEDDARPGIVHRLDKDTSGVMLIAKTPDMFDYLKDVFASRRIKKQYIALVCGNITSRHGFINDPIGRHPTDFRKMTTLRPKEPKESITEYTVLEHVDGYTLVRVNLHTGRTHQIRVHFSSQGFPIAGDALYGKCSARGLRRQFLHASQVEVQMPDKTWIEAHAPLPEDLKKTLRELNFKSIDL
ncbi:RluA family pseudouridine synthase [Patescibacteria group bacterium]|nr:RluA family pseudouridine synthase [Patescibacteria group bacterium]